MKRNIISIDEAKCTGCGECIPGCPEGAIQLIDGKARLVSDLMCDGLGACLGQCPEEAITIEEREAEPYDERKVMANIVRQGAGTIRAHLDHLRDHHQDQYYREALACLRENGLPIPEGHAQPGEVGTKPAAQHSGCPGSRTFNFSREGHPAAALEKNDGSPTPSQLTHWPIQLHLISPGASHYAGSDLLLAADCVAYALGGFHQNYLRGKTLAIACPKLDEGQEIYLEKLRALVDTARINSLTVMIMQVPCCRGLLMLARQALAQAGRKVPLKCVVVGLQGEILQEEWVS
jgi:Pyruvate/2-oxoacid:ferredoxin oxidoreductase delta subunit